MIDTIDFEDVNISSPAFKANPYPFYTRLREKSPVCRVRLPNKQDAYLVVRYDDVLALLKDNRFVKDKKNALTPAQLAKQPWVPPVFAPLMRNMLDVDDPDHARLRHLVQKAFTPRRIDQMRECIQATTDSLLENIEGNFDLIHTFAMPLPVTVIADLLGVPEQDRVKFVRWSNTMAKNTASPVDMVRSVPDLLAFVRYIRWLIRLRRAEPQDDLISALVQVEEAGDSLNEDELLAMIAILLTAGHETTTSLIANGTLALLQHPEQLERVRAEPDHIKTAVEELLRFAGPADMATHRYAREEVTIAETTLPKGVLVFAVLGSANRDATQFPQPETLDITRTPNRHLAFGQGSHYCVGAALARMEGQIAINTLLKRFPNLQLAQAPDLLKWRRGLVLRGLESLPLTT
jgi:cytochrome P450